jgi:diphthine-ammonia ligase
MLNFLAHYTMNFPNVQATFEAVLKFTYTVDYRECMFCIKLPTAFAVPTGPLVINKTDDYCIILCRILMSNSRLCAVSFTGGKDSVAALEICLEMNMKPTVLITFSPEEIPDFKAHKFELMKLQSESLGIKHRICIVQGPDYAGSYRSLLISIRDEFNITALVTGDILDVNDRFMSKVCESTGVSLVCPLWELPRQTILEDMWMRGIEFIITCTNTEQMIKAASSTPHEKQLVADMVSLILGARLTKEFYEEVLCKLPGVDACGEGGEFHTMVLDSPSFAFKIVVDDAYQPAECGAYSYLNFDMKAVSRIQK